MAKKRVPTPPPDDVDRISDIIWADSRGKIVDRHTFNMHFDDFIGKYTTKQDSVLRDSVFEDLREKHPRVEREDVTVYRYTGIAKGKEVRVRMEYVTVKDKRVRRYRDSRGRFASLKS